MIQITLARLITLGLLLLNVALVTAAQVLLKAGTVKFAAVSQSKGVVSAFFKIIVNPYIMGGTSCYVLSLVLWIYILTRAKLSMAYPIMSLSYVTVMVLSVLLFRENINFNQWIGALLIVVGTSLIFIFK